MLNEFLLHEIEKLLCEDSMKELMLNMVNCQATELSDSSFIDSLGPDFLSKPNFHTQETQALTNSLRQRRKSKLTLILCCKLLKVWPFLFHSGSKTQHLNKKIKVEGGERLSRLMVIITIHANFGSASDKRHSLFIEPSTFNKT